jgi:group I intron endonuclease
MKFCVDENFKSCSGVYKISSLLLEEVYIGSAVNLFKRFNEHDDSLDSNTHRNIFLQRSFSKVFGVGFKFELLELVESESDLIIREQFHIDSYPLKNCSIYVQSPDLL